ncbi:hypothetical protein PSECIP111951_02317 [Pseudoalteromonas holothuriae]|uniref:N-acetyltransferase domain-containing protein n=1 Tax=Pseudoalteromonas holothuriae TaxID=2963714 RepID=A0ABM9GJ99_9GAMM|nr:GNAT family N-acetyltransferase [Pseudoalteromonas sp. CIP111951]CAH9060611.1 hypothetical protein PSECIP111951_02317 [Pseudoalteromonas sp. CIP111951]
MEIIDKDAKSLTVALSLPSNFTIRNAVLSDAQAMAGVTFESWQTAFSEFLPQEVLEKGTLDFFENIWHAMLAKPKKHSAVLLCDGSKIIACGTAGAYRNLHNPVSRKVCKLNAGELYRGYVLPSYQNKGIGQALLKARLLKLHEQGYHKAYTWIYAKNTRACMFYEKYGAVNLDRALGLTMNKYPFDEVCYGIEVESVFNFT